MLCYGLAPLCAGIRWSAKMWNNTSFWLCEYLHWKFMGIQLVLLIKMFEILGHTDVQILDAKLYMDHMAWDARDKEKMM